MVAFEDGTGYAKVTEVEKIEGDVTVQSRKQKKFPLYELEITLKWEGQLYDDQGKVKAEAKGRVKIPDLSEEKERTEKGWKGLLLDRIKAMLGGSVLK